MRPCGRYACFGNVAEIPPPRYARHLPLTREARRPVDRPPQRVKKHRLCYIENVGATIGRPPAWRSNALSGMAFLQGIRARASNARPYRSFSTVCGGLWTGRTISDLPIGRRAGCPHPAAEGSRPLPTNQPKKRLQALSCGPGMPGPYITDAALRLSFCAAVPTVPPSATA